MKEAISGFDCDVANEVVAESAGFVYGELSIGEELKKIGTLVEDFDYDNAEELLNQLIERCKVEV